MKKVVITIKKNGETSIEAVGFQGQGCTQATEPYEKALGEVQKREIKPEAYVEEQEFQNENN